MVLILLLFNLYYVDQPYLNVPEHGEFNIQLRFGPGGEILGFANVGVLDRLSFGVSYGASNLIGAGDPEFYEKPGIQARILVIEQGFAMPEVLLGFDNQGYGQYDGVRYLVMSKGLYCQLGRALYSAYVEIVPSLGFNYCFEQENRFDMFLALSLQFGSSSALLVEYSPNINDDIDQNNGYLNTGIRLIFYEELFFEFALRDLLGNSPSETDQQMNRMLRLGFRQVF